MDVDSDDFFLLKCFTIKIFITGDQQWAVVGFSLVSCVGWKTKLFSSVAPEWTE